MKWFIDGDQIAITRDDFVDLQESPAVFVPIDSKIGIIIIKAGIMSLSAGTLAKFQEELQR